MTMESSLVELHSLHDQISVLLVAFLILQGICKYFDGKKKLMEKYEILREINPMLLWYYNTKREYRFYRQVLVYLLQIS